MNYQIKSQAIAIALFTDKNGLTLCKKSLKSITFYDVTGKKDGFIDDLSHYSDTDLTAIFTVAGLDNRDWVFNTGFPVVIPARLAGT